MMEGIVSLMQLAKVSDCAGNGWTMPGVPYISVLTDPTTGGRDGQLRSWLGDLNIAETWRR